MATVPGIYSSSWSPIPQHLPCFSSRLAPDLILFARIHWLNLRLHIDQSLVANQRGPAAGTKNVLELRGSSVTNNEVTTRPRGVTDWFGGVVFGKGFFAILGTF